MNKEKTFAEMLRCLREDRSLSLRELAKRSGVNHSNIVKFESGKRRCGMNSALKLADALGMGTWQRAEFMRKAQDVFRGHSVNLDQVYPQLLYERLDAILRNSGLAPDRIGDIASNGKDDITIVGRDGKRISIQVKGS